MDFSVFNELSKFDRIKFDEESHTYTVDRFNLTSVTKLIGSVEHFDEISIATKQAESTGVPIHIILAKWRKKGEYARLKGTEMHSYIENLWLNNKYKFKTFNDHLEMFVELDVLKEQYETFYYAARKIMSLVKTEFRVYDIEHRVAGTVDGLFHNTVNNCFDIWDWKTSTEISKHNRFGEKLIGLEHLDNCNFNIYALQLSIYKYIIEKNTNIKIKNLHICQISTLNKAFNAFKVPYLKDEAVYLLEKNKKTILS